MARASGTSPGPGVHARARVVCRGRSVGRGCHGQVASTGPGIASAGPGIASWAPGCLPGARGCLPGAPGLPVTHVTDGHSRFCVERVPRRHRTVALNTCFASGVSASHTRCVGRPAASLACMSDKPCARTSGQRADRARGTPAGRTSGRPAQRARGTLAVGRPRDYTTRSEKSPLLGSLRISLKRPSGRTSRLITTWPSKISGSLEMGLVEPPRQSSSIGSQARLRAER